MQHRKQKFDKSKEYPRHPLAHKTGGVHMNSEDETKFSNVAGAVLRQIGTKITKGDFNLATLSKPIVLTHPMTLSECLSCDYFYTDPYINEAAKCSDPLHRMQLIVTDLVASIHQTHVLLKSLAPIDCILGETINRVKSDGTRFYAEFIKNDPPTTLYQVYGPNDDWMIYGVDEVEAEIHPTLTQIIGRNKRLRYIKFKDGRIYTIQLPTMIVNGLLKGDRILNKMDTAIVKCEQDKLIAQISFSYVYEGKLSKMKNKLMFWSQSNEKPLSDLVDVTINKQIDVDDENEVFTLSRGSGSWLSYLEFDGELYWRINDEITDWDIVQALLQSDSTYREDKRLMLSGQYEKAQLARNQIEDQIAKDIQLRKKFMK